MYVVKMHSTSIGLNREWWVCWDFVNGDWRVSSNVDYREEFVTKKEALEAAGSFTKEFGLWEWEVICM